MIWVAVDSEGSCEQAECVGLTAMDTLVAHGVDTVIESSQIERTHAASGSHLTSDLLIQCRDAVSATTVTRAAAGMC